MGVFCVGCCYIVDKIHLFINEASVRYKKKKEASVVPDYLANFQGIFERICFILPIYLGFPLPKWMQLMEVQRIKTVVFFFSNGNLC